MAEQIQRLEVIYKRSDIEVDSDKFKDEGDLWELRELEWLQAWTTIHVPMTEIMAVATKFVGSGDFQLASYEEKVIDIHNHDKYILMKCETIDEPSYQYTTIFDCTSALFDILPFLATLANIDFEHLIKEMEIQIDGWQWLSSDGLVL